MPEPASTPNLIKPSKGVVSKDEAARTSAVIDKATADDPALLNTLNQEPLIQSGVLWYGSFGVLASVGILLQQTGQHGTDFGAWNLEASVGAVLSLWSAAGVIYRRAMPGLRPMWYRVGNWWRGEA